MTTLTLRVRTNPGDTTSPVALTMEQVDDNFIALKDGITVVQQTVTENDPIPMAIALG